MDKLTLEVLNSDPKLKAIHDKIHKIEDWNALSKEPTVTICMATYNHENYIKEALDGVLMQKTNFDYEIIIKEDFSSDKTREIVLDYQSRHPDKIRLWVCKENLYSQKMKPKLKAFARGKYIAICEGDDYWTDSLKLQKQVDFLEENEDFGLVHTDFEYVNTSNEPIPPPTDLHKGIKSRIFNGFIWDYYLNNAGFILTVTCMYRTSLLRKGNKPRPKYSLDGWLFMELARQSKVYYIPEKTCAYRINPSGMMMSGRDYINKAYPYIKYDQICAFFNSERPTNSFYKRRSTYMDILKSAKNCFIKLPSNEVYSKIKLLFISIKCVFFIVNLTVYKIIRVNLNY